MNKTEQKKYLSIKKFVKPLEKYIEDPLTRVEYDGEGNFTRMVYHDETGTIAFIDAGNNSYAIYDSVDFCDINITETKEDLKLRISVYKEIDW